MPDKKDTTEGEDKELEALLQKIYEERGMDFREYKRASLKRRIQKRLEANNQSSYVEYISLLDRQPEEYAKLFDTLLINVTEFFRDFEAFEVLGKDVIPQIISRKKKGESIRIWSAGCASGEEPYSIGILLAEALGESVKDHEIRIYATDIDENALLEARRGSYNENKLKNVRHEYLDRYFTRENGSYRINRAVRQMVIFGRQNLTLDAPISHLDLIVCRNVLIYFNLDLQNKLMMRFNYALNKGAYMFFGKSESMLAGSKLFMPVDRKWRIFQKSPQAMVKLAARDIRRAAAEENLIGQAIEEARGELTAMEFYNQSIIQNISLVLIVIDMNKRITTWSRTSEEMWLIKAENAIGRDFFEIGMEHRLPGIREIIDKVILDKRVNKIEELETVDYRGEKKFLNLNLVPLIDPGGEMHGVIIISKDVTDDKALKDDLKKSNEELQSLNAKLEVTNEELATTNEELESANEELETTTEELQSTAEELETSNEELQSTNEELETTNEELQSTNEELETTNEELRHTTDQLDEVNLYNKAIIQSIGQSLVVLNKNGIITTWNPGAEELWRIKEEDAVGNTFFGIMTELGFETEEIRQKIREIIEHRKTYHKKNFEYFTSSGEKGFLELTVVPLIDITGEPLGTILISWDITKEIRAEEIINGARDYAESIVETLREPLIVLDEHLRVKSANQAFYDTFNFQQAGTENEIIYDIGNHMLDIPKLRELLEEIIPRDDSFQDFEVDYEFPGIGKKTMLLNARRIFQKGIGTGMILLAIHDTTQRPG